VASEGPLEHAIDDVTPRTTEAGKARGSFVMRMAILSIWEWQGLARWPTG